MWKKERLKFSRIEETSPFISLSLSGWFEVEHVSKKDGRRGIGWFLVWDGDGGGRWGRGRKWARLLIKMFNTAAEGVRRRNAKLN